MSIESSLLNRNVIVLLGAGGVGKTSCAVGLAIKATRAGRKVGLLSIDPAKRLAAAMGISLGGQLKKITFPQAQAGEGELWAAMLDPKEVFDGMVKRFAPEKETAAKILEHRLYIAASTSMAGAGEYMALAKLQDMLDSQAFDLIILDTPPDTHALEFLSRPNILAGFMENKVLHWLVKPFFMAGKLGINKLFTVGERLMGGLARVTGFQALHMLSEFLLLMQQVIHGFHSVSEKILATLHSPKSGFVVVTACQYAALRSARHLLAELQLAGYALDGLIFNKCLAPAVAEALQKRPLPQSAQGLAHELLKLLYLRGREEGQLQASLLKSIQADLSSRHFFTQFVAEVSESLHSLSEIYRFSFAFDTAQDDARQARQSSDGLRADAL